MKYALKAIPRGNLLHPEFVLRGLRNQRYVSDDD